MDSSYYAGVHILKQASIFINKTTLIQIFIPIRIIKNNKLENHSLTKGDVIIFASVGAGMHINAIAYKY